MTDIIKDCEYAPYQITDAFYDLYGSEMVADDGWRQYTSFELLASLDHETRKEILGYLADHGDPFDENGNRNNRGI